MDSLVKITDSRSAFDFLTQNSKIKKNRAIDYFFTLYLDKKNQVIDFKSAHLKKDEDMSEAINQILDFDKTSTIDSVLVIHQPSKFRSLVDEKELAKNIEDKAFFSLVNLIDFMILLSPNYYISLFDRGLKIPSKHSRYIRKCIKINEPKYSIQQLFEMDIESLKSILDLEYEKTNWADSFIFWETIDNSNEFLDFRSKPVYPWDLQQPASKIYLISVINEYILFKGRLIKFIIDTNRYEKYLFFMFDYDKYKRLREQKKTEKKPIAMQINWRNSITLNVQPTFLTLTR